MFIGIALAALAAAQAAAPQSSSQWVPLKPTQGMQQATQPVASQAVIQPTPAAPITAPAFTNAILRVGTVVPLRLSEQLTTKGKKLRVGARFHLETSEPVWFRA